MMNVLGYGFVFQEAVSTLTIRCLYKACFTKPISWNFMYAVDEKQETKLLWPYKSMDHITTKFTEIVQNYTVKKDRTRVTLLAQQPLLLGTVSF